MFDSSEQRDEFQTLKDDVTRLLNTTSEGTFHASRSHDHFIADQVKAALNDLTETLSEQETYAEHIISDRPITLLASAFALDIVVGFMLRRH